MSVDEIGLSLNTVTQQVIGCVYTVSNKLGCGFLEKAYENALAYELRKNGLKAAQQQSIRAWYDQVVVGDFVADVLVNERVLIELKVAKALDDAHVAQYLNYLKATHLQICLLINFGRSRVEVRRIVHNL